MESSTRPSQFSTFPRAFTCCRHRPCKHHASEGCEQGWLTFCKATTSFSGDTMDRMSLVMMGGAPGSGEGVVPNSRLEMKRSSH